MRKAHRLSQRGNKRSVKTGRSVSDTARQNPDRTPPRDKSTDTGDPNVGSLSSEHRRAHIERISTNVAEWSADLNRRLA